MSHVETSSTSANPSSPGWLDNPDVIVFAGDQDLPVGAIEQHGIRDVMGDLFGRTKEDVKADWAEVVGQIRFLLDGVSAHTQDYTLDEITFELGFSAEGKVVFIAKGGITATISATFKRKQTQNPEAQVGGGDKASGVDTSFN